MKRHTGIFTARGDDSCRYTIYEYTEFIDAGSQDDPYAEITGLKELRTSDGMPVNFIEAGIYKIVATGVILRAN
jgi:hypothetical protein